MKRKARTKISRDDPYRAVNFPIDTDGDQYVLTEKSFIIFTADL